METPIKDIAKLSKQGTAGVIIALIIVIVIAFYFNYSMATKYISKANDINLQLTNAVTELSTIIKLPNRLTKK